MVMSASCFSGEVGLPMEHVALPPVSVEGSYLVCVWDEAAQDWLQGFESYPHTGSYEFQIPDWGKWYWVGLWDETKGEYVFGKWIGHFKSE